MKKFLIALVFLASACGQGFQPNSETVEKVSGEIFSELVESGKNKLVDVRTAEEFVEGHIEGAENIDLLSIDFIDRVNALDKETPVMIYCRTGSRSEDAAKIMATGGIKKVFILDEGFTGWEESGKKTVK